MALDNTITGTDKIIKNFVEKVYDKVKDKEDRKDHEVDMMSKDYTGVYGSFLLLENSGSNIYFIEVLNTRIRQVVPIYSYFFFKKIHSTRYYILSIKVLQKNQTIFIN